MLHDTINFVLNFVHWAFSLAFTVFNIKKIQGVFRSLTHSSLRIILLFFLDKQKLCTFRIFSQ